MPEVIYPHMHTAWDLGVKHCFIVLIHPLSWYHIRAGHAVSHANEYSVADRNLFSVAEIIQVPGTFE